MAKLKQAKGTVKKVVKKVTKAVKPKVETEAVKFESHNDYDPA